MVDGPKLPPDWDWVAHRADCSAAKLFERLYLQAKKNVEARNAQLPAPMLMFTSNEPDIFSVARATFGGRTAAVRFYRVEEQISIEGSGPAVGDVKIEGTATLTDDGRCKLKVGAAELDEWQVLRRALEPLFFGTFR